LLKAVLAAFSYRTERNCTVFQMPLSGWLQPRTKK